MYVIRVKVHIKEQGVVWPGVRRPLGVGSRERNFILLFNFQVKNAGFYALYGDKLRL